MYLKYCRLLATAVAAIILTLSMTESLMGWAMYKSDVNPGTAEPPSSPWVLLSGKISLSAGTTIWIAVDNYHIPTYTKNWFVEVTAPEKGVIFTSYDWNGYYNPGPLKSVTRFLSVEYRPGPPTVQRWNFESKPQPDWEVAVIHSTASTTTAIQQDSVEIHGNSVCRPSDPLPGPCVSIRDLRNGAPYDTILLTQVWIFNDSTPVDTSVVPTIEAPPGSGLWSHEFVYIDPDGNNRPQGGVRWYNLCGTPSCGIESEQEYDIAFCMNGTARSNYTLYVYDEVHQDYERFVIPPTTATIPTLSEWGLILFAFLLFATLAFYIHRTRKLTAPAALGLFLLAFTITFYFSSSL